MREKEIENIKNKLLYISDGKYLELDAPKYYPNPHFKLDKLIEKLSDEEVTILWNVQPWDNFNILHAIYCQKLKECIELGFNVIVLFYDKLVEKLIEKKLKSPVDPNYVKTNVENNIKWFKRAGLKDKKTEFLTESLLWEIVDPQHFMETITSLAHLCVVNGKLVDKENLISFIIDNLCEIYYESVLNCDILLTGDIDVQKIWNMLRGEMLMKNREKYEPPLILTFPTLLGIDGSPLTTYTDKNSLSINLGINELKMRIETCPEKFLETLFDFLIIPNKEKVIKIDEESFTSFKSLKNRIEEERIRSIAFEFIKEYFKEIRGGALNE